MHTEHQVQNNAHGSTVDRQEILQFNDSAPTQQMSFNYIQDPTFNDGAADDNSLQNFFRRPVAIANTVWAEGNSLDYTINPWHAYFNNTYVKKKIDNYSLVRCNLKIKLLINSSPFYYSLGMMSYHPLVNFDGHDMPAGAGTVSRNVSFSQRPKIFFSPQDSQGGEMLLPFFHYKNWLRVTDANDFLGMGRLNITSFTELRNSNGVVGGNVNIQIYAWAEDVVLAAPTAGLALQSQVQTLDKYDEFGLSIQNCLVCDQHIDDCTCNLDDLFLEGARYSCDPSVSRCMYITRSVTRFISRLYNKRRTNGFTPVRDLELQSALSNLGNNITSMSNSISNFAERNGKATMNLIKDVTGTKDEYGVGPVSKMASAIASFSGKLAQAPIIKPFATATSFCAEATGRIASFFGWSNPPIIDDVHAYRATIFPHFASPEISNPTEKLTLDPKNELCVDSRTVGLDGTDEMTIPSIVERESYIGSFGFTQANAADTLLWSSVVRPTNCWYDSTAGGYAATPMAHLSQMFAKWRGDLIFRFKFIATKYHNGRVIISWDPYTDITGLTDTETVNYTQVYDLTDGCDVEMRIPYMQETPFLDTSGLVTKYSSITPQTGTIGLDNGAITVRVLNELTAPDSSSSIDCAVFVRAADNFELAEPKNIDRYSYFEPQSKEENLEFLFQSTESSLEDTVMSNQNDPVDHLYLSYMGERVRSIRTLLRRSCWSTTLRPTTPAGTDVEQYQLSTILSRYPLQFGFDSTGVHTTSLAKKFNYSSVHPLNWMAPCYVGQRGGIVVSVNPSTNGIVNTMHINRTVSTRTIANFTDYRANITSTNSLFNSKILEVEAFQHLGGGAITNIRTAAGLQVHAPFYSRYRFDDTSPSTTRSGNSDVGSDTDSLRLSVSCAGNTEDIGNTRYELYYGAGIDYNLFFYLNVPFIYDQSTLPAPST